MAPAPQLQMEGAPEAQMPTRIWANLKDGQNYRSRVDGATLFLDAIASGGKISGQFAGCEFHHAGTGPSDWVGMCTELGGNGEALRKLPATLSRFSEDRIEGSTGDIPVFVMTPVDTALPIGDAAPTRTDRIRSRARPRSLAPIRPRSRTSGSSTCREIPHLYPIGHRQTARIQLARLERRRRKRKTRPSPICPV